MNEMDGELPVLPSRRAGACPFDPSPQQARWRAATGPTKVSWNGVPVWAVNRFDDVRAALADPAISSAIQGTALGDATGEIDGIPASFPRMDDPEHARLRKMLTDDFTVKRVRELRPKIQEIADAALDQMIANGPPADLVRDYALPIPSMTISLLLGVPYSDHELFERLSSTAFTIAATAKEKLNASIQLFSYLLELAKDAQQRPGDGLISRSVQQHVASGDLTLEAVAINSLVLLTAGHETTANMIALGILALLRNPETMARVRHSPGPQVMSKTVEELLRYLTIVQDLIVRVARKDVTIGDQLIRAGEGLFMNLPVANRDPAQFERPDVLDINLRRRGHVAFGHGIHNCLGQVLARVELAVAYGTILRRLPSLHLAIPFGDVDFRHDMGTFGVHRLPVTW